VKTNHKYKAKRIIINNNKFASRAEAAYYLFHLIPALEKKEIKEIQLQPRIKIEIKDKKICHYIADFLTIDLNNNQKIIEIKGFKTDIYKLKLKLTKAVYPALKILEISAKDLRLEVSLLKQLQQLA
tara:strand:+ start:123 stop:503 length:381 start_codon:yes stop_codon:yes gene_type:complete